VKENGSSVIVRFMRTDRLQQRQRRLAFIVMLLITGLHVHVAGRGVVGNSCLGEHLSSLPLFFLQVGPFNPVQGSG